MHKLAGLVLIVGVTLCVSASAAPRASVSDCPTESAFSCVTAIDDLEILGHQYDMTVVVGTFQSLFDDPSKQLASWGRDAFANAANTAIASFLNLLSPQPTELNTKFFDSTDSPYRERVLHLPTMFDVGTASFQGRCTIIGTDGVAPGDCRVWLTSDIDAFAVFVPATPCEDFPGGGNTRGCFPGPKPFPATEPGTLTLLGLSFADLALSRRRKL